jgi:predicted transcriptional regulator
MTETVKESLEQLIEEGLVEQSGDSYRLTAKGLAVAEIQWSTDVMPETGADYGNA